MVVKVVFFVYLTARLVGCLGVSVLKVDIAGVVNKKSDFSFWIESDACRIYLFFRSLYIASILYCYNQYILVSLCLTLLIIKFDTLLTPWVAFFLA